MAAGLGFKTFAVGEVLSAANVNGYLMQGVLVFASAAARDADITSPQEGQFAYLKDTNVTTYYTGSAWANLDTTGMTNPMTTTGDTIYSSSGSTPARLGIGSTGQVLTVAGGVPSWATPAAAAGFTSKANYVITDQSTSSTSYTNLTTTQSVTLTTGTKALIFLSSNVYNSGTNANYIGFDVSGATTVAASNNYAVLQKMDVGTTTYSNAGAFYYDALTAGSNTFTMKFRVSAGTGNFYNRCIAVIDMGS